MSIRSAADPASLHDEAFAADPFAGGVVDALRAGEVDLVGSFTFRLPGLVIVRLFSFAAGDEEERHQYHLTVPYLRATLTQEGSS